MNKDRRDQRLIEDYLPIAAIRLPLDPYRALQESRLWRNGASSPPDPAM